MLNLPFKYFIWINQYIVDRMLRPVLRKLRNKSPAQYHPQLPRWRLARLQLARLQLAKLYLQRRRLLSLHHLWHLLTLCSFWLYLACLLERLCGLEVYDTYHATFLQVFDRSTVGLRTVTWWSKIVLLSIRTFLIPKPIFPDVWHDFRLETKTSFDIYHVPLNLLFFVHLATAWSLSLPWVNSKYNYILTLPYISSLI